jgi:uroporphyrinogen decarboxylase
MSDYRSDPEAVVKAHLQAWETYGHDCLLVDLDTTLLAEAMGATADASGDEPAHIAAPAISSLDDVGSLRPADPMRDGRLPVFLEAIYQLDKAVGREVSIRANCDQGAFSLACLLRGSEEFLMDLAEDPTNPAIFELLDVCHASHLALHRAAAAAGGHFTSLGDSFSGPDVVSPQMFDHFARPYEERLVRELASEGVFTVIHICGDTTQILNSMAAYPYCGFELDYKTNAREAKRTVGAGHVLFGNIDPSGVVGRGNPDAIRQASQELIQTWSPGGHFVFNSGCAIPAGTPSENLHTLVQSAAEFGIPATALA